MKKLVLLLVVALGFSFAQAQSEGIELGLRSGGGAHSFSAIDFVYGLSDKNRIHADLAFGNRYLNVEGLYEWQFPIGENFVIYPGFGLGFYSWEHYYNKGWYYNKKGQYVYDEGYERYSTVGILGVIGIEYQIQPIPLSVGIDFRPSFGFSNDYGFGSYGAAMVRYRF